MDYVQKNPLVNTMIVGHTHDPFIRTYPEGATLINTGTWTRMYHLDFERREKGGDLTYAQIDLFKGQKPMASLQIWQGVNNLPFDHW